MARLVAFGADNGTLALSELDTVDLEAIALSHAWGLSNGHTERIHRRLAADPTAAGPS